MNLILWIVAVLLASAFLAGGLIKLTQPQQKLATAPSGGWVEDVGGRTVKAIGTLEVLAASGLILPAATGIAPILVPLAAVGLLVLMAGVIVVHVRRREWTVILVNLTYIALAAFVAWGRFGPESFTG